MKPYKIWACTLFIGSVLLGGCQSASTANQADTQTDLQPLTLGLTYIPNVQFSPFYVAKEKAFFTKVDPAIKERHRNAKALDVALRHHGSDEGLFSALIAGTEQAVVAFGDEVVQAASQGLPVQAVATLYRKYPVEIITKCESGIKSFEALKGKKIGLPGRFGSNWLGLQAGLNAENIKLSDVEIVEIGYTQQAQLTTGKVDAVVGFSNNDSVRFALAGVCINRIPLPSQAQLASASLVVTKDFALNNPEKVEILASGMAQGIVAVSNDPQDAINLTASKYDDTLVSPESQKAAKEVLKATIEVMDLKKIKNAKDPGASVSPDLAVWQRTLAALSKTDGALGNKLNLADPKALDSLVRTWPKP